ncbi:MAG: MFS transporter [Anaerolineae bacterium]
MDRVRGVWERLRRALADLLARVRYRLGESGWARLPVVGSLRPQELLARPQQLGRRWRKTRAKTDRNIWYLYVEVFWAGIFLAALAFNATYALRLGASNTMIGWLSSIPALLAIGVLLPAASFLEKQSNRGVWLRRSLFVGRLAFLGAAIGPWIFPRHAAEVVVAILILRAIPMNFYSAGFSPMLADVIPMRDRARVMANRSIISSATVAACTFLFGRWMDLADTLTWAKFPVNFQVVYLIGTVAGLLSTYYVSRIEVPETGVIQEDKETGAERRRPLASRLADVRQLFDGVKGMVRENRDFAQIIINTFVFDFGAWMVMPLYVIFFIRQLNASDGWVGLNTTVAHIGVIAGNTIWRRLVDRLGPARSLRLAVPMAATYAFLVSLFPNLTLILLWGVLVNLINPGVSLSHVTLLYTLCPPERRTSYLAIYSTVANIGAFLAPMIGVALSGLMDIRWILMIGGAIRLIGAGLFHRYRIEMPEAAAAQ